MTAEALAPGLRRIVAPNPSPMTWQGTNTYLVGAREIAVIDPGPMIESHLAAIQAALAPGQRISHILVTHSHRDHSPLARPLAEATGAPILAAGNSDWGRSALMQELAASGQLGGGEGVDEAFSPDRQLSDGEVIAGEDWQITALHTPGHMANHLSFAWGEALFSGDLVMGWSTSLVSPPDGDMTAFFASLARLSQREDQVYYPGHGEPVGDPAARLAELIAHRRGREAAILEALDLGPANAAELARRIYHDLEPHLLPLAERNVLAHLLDLLATSRIDAMGDLSPDIAFQRL